MTEAEKAVNRVLLRSFLRGALHGATGAGLWKKIDYPSPLPALFETDEKARQITMDGLRESIAGMMQAEQDEITNLGILALEAEMWADDSKEGSALRSEMLSAARDYRARQNQLIAEREARNWKPYPLQNVVYQPAISRSLLRTAGIIFLGAVAIALIIVFRAQIVEFLWGSMQ